MNIPFRITTETKFLYNPQMKGAYNFVPGVLGMILMLICAMMTSIAIVREKEMGTMEVLLVSPMKPILIILAKVVPYFVISFVNLITVLLLSVFVLGVPIAGSLFWLIIVSMLFIFVSLSLGLLVSTLTESQMAAMLISGMAFMMPVMLLSGMMFPIESMPMPLRILSNVIPAKWFIIAIKNLMIKGTGISAVLKEILILCVMATVILTVSFKKFKNRLE
jgi:ABC-2 type transport system permease protein